MSTVMPLITSIAYRTDKNLGAAYNDIMRPLTDAHWVCFIDHDAMFTTPVWYHQLCIAIEMVGHDAGIITAHTNRIACNWQRTKAAPPGHDIIAHRRFGELVSRLHGQDNPVDVTKEAELSGVVMCLSKRTWINIGGFKDGFLGVDNAAHRDVRRIGKKVYLIPGLYVYHWYRETL